MTYSELYREGVGILTDADILEAALDARLLLEYICKTDRNTLLAHPEMEVMDVQAEMYRVLIGKRSRHIPLQHITGHQEFMGLNFNVNESVLIPRQDTEYVVEEVLKYTQDGMRVLDMCTGSGCILLSIMNYKNNIQGVGVDISEKALEVARHNATNLQLNAEFMLGNMFEAIKEDKYIFDIIVSNPPYIEEEEISKLMPEVKDHEPVMALSGGTDGLDFYRIIAHDARNYLTNYGMLFLEIGYNQSESVPKILAEYGYADIECLRDYSNNPRVVIAKYVHDL